MATDPILDRLGTIRNLPSLPAVVNKVRQAVRNPRADARRIAGIIEDDPSMMTRILKVVNSAFYGGVEPITSVQQAVARMGFNAVSNIAMSTSVFSSFGRDDEAGFDREEFWRHCISTGIAANVLYDATAGNLNRRYSADVLHLAGLLHDIGKIIFEQFFHEEFAVALERCAFEHRPLFSVETEILSANHSFVGAWLGEKWNLSPEVVEAIAFHHDPENACEEYRELVMLCHAANFICNLRRIGNSGDSTAPSFVFGVWKHLGFDADDIPLVVDKIQEESAKSEILLSFL